MLVLGVFLLKTLKLIILVLEMFFLQLFVLGVFILLKVVLEELVSRFYPYFTPILSFPFFAQPNALIL